MAVQNTLVSVNVLQRCMTENKTVGAGNKTHCGGCCSTELFPMPQLMSLWSVDNAHQEAAGRCPCCWSQKYNSPPPILGMGITSRLGIQVYLIRLSCAICQLAKPFFQIFIPNSHHCKWRKSYVLSHFVKSQPYQTYRNRGVIMKQVMYVKLTEMSGSDVLCNVYTASFQLQRYFAENLSSKIPGFDALPNVFTHEYFGIYISKVWMTTEHILRPVK